ncbi:unnamed protein product [Closterium sp. NIES-54]
MRRSFESTPQAQPSGTTLGHNPGAPTRCGDRQQRHLPTLPSIRYSTQRCMQMRLSSEAAEISSDRLPPHRLHNALSKAGSACTGSLPRRPSRSPLWRHAPYNSRGVPARDHH